MGSTVVSTILAHLTGKLLRVSEADIFYRPNALIIIRPVEALNKQSIQAY